MAHHASTPQSVLDAPRHSYTQETPLGLTRRERRHGIQNPGLDVKGFARYVRAMTHAEPNQPHVRTTARRGKKVRRGSKAA